MFVKHRYLEQHYQMPQKPTTCTRVITTFHFLNVQLGDADQGYFETPVKGIYSHSLTPALTTPPPVQSVQLPFGYSNSRAIILHSKPDSQKPTP